MYRGGPLLTPAATELQVDDMHHLRHVTPDDAEELFALVEDNREHLREWLPWVDGIKTVEDERRVLTFFEEERAKGKAAHWIIRSRSVEKDRAIGMVGINWVDQHNGGCLLGYWISQNEAGKGNITTAMRRLIDYCVDELHLHRIALEIPEENKRSRSVSQRLGFDLEGIMKGKQWQYDRFLDLALYAITAPEWKARNHRV